MLTLSRLLRASLVDRHGRRAPLHDLAVDPRADEHPPVTHVLFSGGRDGTRALPCALPCAPGGEPVAELAVDDLARAEPPGEELIRLRRDVLDALVLDLERRTILRADDLVLRVEDDRLRLVAVDSGARAILRRMSRGRLFREPRPPLADWKYVEYLRGEPEAAPHGHNGGEAGRPITRLQPAEIARLLARLPYPHAAELVLRLGEVLGADTLEAMQLEHQLLVLDELDDERAMPLLKHMAPDNGVRLLSRLAPERARRLLERLPARARKRLIELLRYPEDTAGGLMTNAIVTVPGELTVAEAREALREPLREPDFVGFVYVIDDRRHRRLRGVLSLRDLLVADDDYRVENVMNPFLERLHPLEDAGRAARQVLRSELQALPVVGEDDRLLGALTFDVALAVVLPESQRSNVPRIFS